MTWVGHRGARRPAGGRRGLRRAPESDAGSSLVEVVISVGVLGTAGVGLLFGLITAIKGAGEHERMATVAARLGTAAEIFHGSEVAYVPCTTNATAVRTAYGDAITSKLPGGSGGATVTVDAVSFWNGTSFVTSCTGIPADALQLVELSAVQGASSAHQSVTKLPGAVIP